MVTSQNGTQAIDRAALLLTQVLRRGESVSFTELASASGLAKSTTSRLLMALQRHQLVRRDDDGRFWPGELFVRYAWRGTASTDLVAIAQPFLERLGELTGETVNLGIATGGTSAGGSGPSASGAIGARGVPERQSPRGSTVPSRASAVGAGGTARAGGGGAGSAAAASRADHSGAGAAVQQIAQVNSRYLIGGTNWVGMAVPLHCSASGKVLLAYGAATLPPGPLEARTARTITNRADLEAELQRARESGYAVTDEELEPGLVAVAAPVFAGDTAAIAAISVSAPSTRMIADQVGDAAASCVAVANALSVTLGGTIGPGQRHVWPAA